VKFEGGNHSTGTNGEISRDKQHRGASHLETLTALLPGQHVLELLCRYPTGGEMKLGQARRPENIPGSYRHSPVARHRGDCRDLAFYELQCFN
jgi:hypothetical protein